MNIENIRRANISRTNNDTVFDPQLDTVSRTNNEKKYEFDVENDLQFVLKNNSLKLKLSINSKIPEMLINRIDKLRVILSYENISNISTEKDKIIYEFFFNVNDYYDFNKRDKILKTRSLKNVVLSNSSNSKIDVKTDDITLFNMILEKRKSLGALIESNDKTSEIFILTNDDNKTIDADINTALMEHIITIPLRSDKRLFIKIIELQRSNGTEGIFENYKKYSINNYFIPNYSNIFEKFNILNTEKNNKLAAHGYNNTKSAIHEIRVINEINDNFSILSKDSIIDGFKRELIGGYNNKSESMVELRRGTPTIYRVIDNNKKLKDVFIGDVKDRFFNSTPSISIFSLNYSINILVHNVPQEYLSYIVYRTEGKNNKTRAIVDTSTTDELNVSRNVMLLKDNNVEDNKTYRYQIKFITNNDCELFTNYSNEQKFIKPSGAYTLSSELVTSDNGSKIVATTTVPNTDAELLFNDISSNFPNIDENQTKLLVDNYSYLSFVKFMKLNKKSGEISTIGLKTVNNNVAEIEISDNTSSSEFSYFCEMFSSSLISALENINSSSKYESAFNDYIPGLGDASTSLGIDRNNFLSKFTGYYSMNDGTLVYGRALAEMPGTIVESAKTGVISVVQIQEQEEQDRDVITSYDIEIVDRNIPKITIELDDENIYSVLIITSDQSIANYRVEKAVYDDNKFVFYDINAQFDFINEIIDYYIVPVYDNYKIKNIEKIGTVLCSKNNFRSI